MVRLPSLLLAGLAWLGPLPLAAQRPEVDAAQRRDSVRALREAQAEQRRFEVLRRRHLPWTWAGGGGPCDERIGRFCLTHDDGGKEYTPPPEPHEVAAARKRLLQRLAASAERIPGDGWIAGHRIRYLVETRKFAEAAKAAGGCRAAGWWCAALAGFAHHHAGRPELADSAYAVMLHAMPAEERERWTDLSPILEGAPLRRYRRLRGAEREAFERRFWELADPFLTRPGNGLRSEHLSRHVLDQLQDRAESAENLSWGADLREILIRYGWPAGWERVRGTRPGLDAPSIISHYNDSEQRLLPPDEVLLPDGGITAGEWDTEARRARAGYQLPAGQSPLRWFHPLDHQLAVFHRGDSVVVVAAYALPPDSLPSGARVDAGLVLATGAGAPVVVRAPEAPVEGALVATAEPGPMLLSLELLADSARRGARVRRGVSPAAPAADRLAVSDLLLLRSADAAPASLEAAVGAARGSTRVRAGEEVGVFWEVYGLRQRPTTDLTVSLRLVDRRKGWLRRVGERIGVVRELEPIRMRWQEQAGGSAPHLARSLAIQIPPLPPGAYAVELTVAAPGDEPVTAAREIEVR